MKASAALTSRRFVKLRLFVGQSKHVFERTTSFEKSRLQGRGLGFSFEPPPNLAEKDTAMPHFGKFGALFGEAITLLRSARPELYRSVSQL
ncbi:hypothetical protein [Litorimonas haliclonae]|uniref:hypothetical protein n=1 Tax=Litorimonas haliclonae TaxID=2081977 RepID=UPI0039EF37C4